MELICYLSNGYPSIEESYKIAVEYADAGCNMIEVDFPAKDPYLEGEYIAGRMKKALEICDDYEKYMNSIVKLKNTLKNTKFLVLAYESTVEEIGVQKFIEFLIVNDLKDLILVGLKNDDIKNKLIQNDIRVSCYIQYHLPEDEVKSALESNGFIYMQAKPTTNMVNPKYPQLKDCINYLKEKGITRPIYCGVGLYEPKDINMVKTAGGDAAFVGSTILKLQDNIPKMKEMISRFKSQC